MLKVFGHSGCLKGKLYMCQGFSALFFDEFGCVASHTVIESDVFLLTVFVD